MSKYIAALGDIQEGALEVADDLSYFLGQIDDLVTIAQGVLDELHREGGDGDSGECETFDEIQESLSEAYFRLDQSISYLMTAVE